VHCALLDLIKEKGDAGGAGLGFPTIQRSGSYRATVAEAAAGKDNDMGLSGADRTHQPGFPQAFLRQDLGEFQHVRNLRLPDRPKADQS
jgi:hypothetical protein